MKLLSITEIKVRKKSIFFNGKYEIDKSLNTF